MVLCTLLETGQVRCRHSISPGPLMRLTQGGAYGVTYSYIKRLQYSTKYKLVHKFWKYVVLKQYHLLLWLLEYQSRNINLAWKNSLHT